MNTVDTANQADARLELILREYQPALTALEDVAWKEHGQHRFGVSYQQGYRRARRDIITWMHDTLTTGFDALSLSEAIAELRKGRSSLYYPLFVEDPKVSGTCDHCRTRQWFDPEAICQHCGTEAA